MRRHKPLQQEGVPSSLVKDHYMHNYVSLNKIEEMYK